LSIRIIKPSYRVFIIFLIILFTFLHWLPFLTGDNTNSKISRNSFILIIFVFFLFFLIINKIKIQKNIGYLFCVFLYFPIIEIIHYDLARSIAFLIWTIYGFLIIPWLLNGQFFLKNLRLFALGSSLVLILICILGFYLNYDQLFFGSNFRIRFSAGLGNPGIISKLGITVFFLSFLIWLLENRFLYLLFSLIGLTVVISAGMRADTYALILSSFFFIICMKPRIYYLGLFILIIFTSSLILFIFNFVEFNIVDSFLSSRLSTMWTPVFLQSEFLNSFTNMLFGIGYYGTYFDNNFLYFLVSFGFLGLLIYLLFHYII